MVSGFVFLKGLNCEKVDDGVDGFGVRVPERVLNDA
jgi:hypothetical protein